VDVIDELEVNCVVGGRCRKRRVEVALAGAVAAIRRKKKSASSFLPHRSGMADRAGHWARQGGLNRWATVPFLPLSLFFLFIFFSYFLFY
jgi:hypothetical protein